MSVNRRIGTGREWRRREEVVEHPGGRFGVGSTIRIPVFSFPPTQVGERMGIFLFEVFVTPSDAELDRLLIPVEEALNYFPSLANRQETYQEKIEISDPQKANWHMTVSYDRSECSFVVLNEWRKFFVSNNLEIMDIICFYKPFPLSYDNRYLVEIDKRRDLDIFPEFKPENLLFQMPLTDMDIVFKRLFIETEDLRNYFPALGIPETHIMERLYFTDYLNNHWCIKVVCYDVICQLMMEEFMSVHVLEVGDTLRFFKPDQPLHSRHFLLGFRKQRGAPTRAGTAATNDGTDRDGAREDDGGGGTDRSDNRESDGGGGTDGCGNREGDGGGGSRSGGRKWWKFCFGGCCMARKSNARQRSHE